MLLLKNNFPLVSFIFGQRQTKRFGLNFVTFDNNRRAKVRLFREQAKIFYFFCW